MRAGVCMMVDKKGTRMMTATKDETTTATRAWSKEQESIFQWFAGTPGNLVVRARAGTGKTTTIIEGVGRAPEKKILLAAFNKTIATELQSRCGGDGARGSRVEARTLHGLGFRFITRARPGIKIEETSGERAMNLARTAAPDAPLPVQRLIRDLHTKARDVDPLIVNGEAFALMDIAMRFDLTPDEEWAARGWGMRQVCEAAHRAMRIAMEPTAVIDFADMIFLPIVHHWIRPWYDLVVIDEAQDMTLPQLHIAVSACRRGGRIAVVGDDRQAIYGFRGADSGSLDRLKAQLRATELGLTVTYRCAKKIVSLASRIVPDYRAADVAPEGEIAAVSVDDMVTKSVKEGDFVLSRKNGPLVRICLALLKRGTRATIRGRDIGKGIVALIRKLAANDPAGLRIAAKSWLEREVAIAFSKMDEEAAQSRADELSDRVAVIDALCDDAKNIAEVETRCEDLFRDDTSRAAVMLSTVHKAKGLEASTVYIIASTMKGIGALIGASVGVAADPDDADDDDDADEKPPWHSDVASDEESNIGYVAITRAKTRLVWAMGELST